jgi:glucose-specific phosphotransferase system IIA component
MGLFSKLFQSNEKNFVSPMTGKVVAMSDIPDPAFAQKMMGDGCGIELTDGTVVAPFDAKVTAAFPTGHAFGLEAKEDGTEVLIHIGIDTVEMEGEGFSSNIKVGDEVKQGDVLVNVDIDYVKSQGKSLVTPIVFTDGRKVELLQENVAVKAGDENIIKL